MNTIPRIEDLWPELGGHFDTFTQILCEFIDNSISNFDASKSRNKSISIAIKEISEDKVKVKIEDTGAGIRNLEAALRLGDKTAIETPLNEHGFGFKHALAAANPDNDDWKLYTRTQNDFKNNQYKVVSAPYRFDMEEEIKNVGNDPWPGDFNGTGTLFEFSCSRLLFDTLRRGIPGRPGFEKCLDYLKEELGYIYAGVIDEGRVTININSDNYNENVSSVTPDWQGFYDPKPGHVDLNIGGGRLVRVEYKFGEIRESSHVRYYRKNVSTNGAEIRINGRAILSNLFKEIWKKENHPQYNHFLVVLNLKSADRDALPKTRTSKNGIRSGDEKLEKLFDWVISTHPDPPKQLSDAIAEIELVRELKSLKEKHIRNPAKRVDMNFKVFTIIDPDYPVKVDLYVFDGSDTVLYEAKKDNADVKDLYQLLMYWDGAVSDGIHPNEGILIASQFSPGVDKILGLLNQMKDQNGNNYKFSKRTWKDEGISYPPP
jgi:hypothetical protein